MDHGVARRGGADRKGSQTSLLALEVVSDGRGKGKANTVLKNFNVQFTREELSYGYVPYLVMPSSTVEYMGHRVGYAPCRFDQSSGKGSSILVRVTC